MKVREKLTEICKVCCVCKLVANPTLFLKICEYELLQPITT